MYELNYRKGSRENRLPFFHARRQKGATGQAEGENPRGIDRLAAQRNSGRWLIHTAP